MREFSTQISDALVNGLRPNIVRDEAAFFFDLYNLVPYGLSLRSYEDVRQVTPDEGSQRYPFPQWFDFENIDLLVLPDRVLKLDTRYTPYDATKLVFNKSEAITFTEQLRGVDYGGSWILLNRDGCVYSYKGRVCSTFELKAAAIIHHRNRTIIGGAKDGFWTKEWLEWFTVFAGKSKLSEDTFSLPLDERTIVWSSFDSLDFPFGLFHPEELDEAFKDRLLGNELGYMQMRHSGKILDMFSAINQLFVFQEDGLTSLADNPDIPGASFAITGEQPIGLKRRGAVGGDRESFIFIDQRNQLWKVNSQGLTKLDFKEYMGELEGEIYITKDPDEELFYIGSKRKSFVLYQNALTRVYQTVQAVKMGDDSRIGQTFTTGNRGALFSTNALDIGMPSLKTLTGVFLTMNRPVMGTVTVESEVRGKSVKRPPVMLNKEGYAAARLYGKNHKIEVRINDFKNLNIDRIELKWQIDDSRYTRGTLVTENATGTGE